MAVGGFASSLVQQLSEETFPQNNFDRLAGRHLLSASCTAVYRTKVETNDSPLAFPLHWQV